jgi:hypothetical protein
LCLEAIHDREEKIRHHRYPVSIDVTLLSHPPAEPTVARGRAHGIHTCNQPTLSSNYRDLQERRRIEEPETGADPSPSKINRRTCRKRDQHESISTTQGATTFLLRMAQQISNHKQVSRNNLLFPYRVSCSCCWNGQLDASRTRKTRLSVLHLSDLVLNSRLHSRNLLCATQLTTCKLNNVEVVENDVYYAYSITCARGVNQEFPILSTSDVAVPTLLVSSIPNPLADPDL